MYKFKVTFDKVEDAQTFCNAVERGGYDVVVTDGRYSVNGSSILGVLSLPITDHVEVQCDMTSEEYITFTNSISGLFERGYLYEAG